MAKITRDDLAHVANLARLELSEEEKGKFTEQLGSILEYFKKLDASDTSEVAEIGQINNMENIVVEDEIGEKYSRDKMLTNAPEEEDGFIKVKAVFEESN